VFKFALKDLQTTTNVRLCSRSACYSSVVNAANVNVYDRVRHTPSHINAV
jgi:hypothetical protein